MIQTKEEMFLAELGINPKEEIEGLYGAKIKIIDLLKNHQAEQLILSGVSHRRELLEGFVDWFNTNDKTQAILSERIEEYLKTL
jgi:hypothetical protein